MTLNIKATYILDFYFDYLCKSCLWAQNKAACDKFDLGPIDATVFDKDGNVIREPKITLPKELQEDVLYLSDLFDSSLNWDSPNEKEPTWSLEKQNEFESKSKILYDHICEFLGKEYEVIYKH